MAHTFATDCDDVLRYVVETLTSVSSAGAKYLMMMCKQL